MVVPSAVILRDCKTGGEIEQLGVGAYRGSLRCLRHSISAVGPKIPYTKKRPLGPVALTSRQTSSLWISGYSGDLPPPSPPAEKATTRQDQAGETSTGDGAGNVVQVEEPNPRGDGRVEVTEVDVTERSGTDDDVIAMCQRERTGDVEQVHNSISDLGSRAEAHRVEYNARVDAVSLIEQRRLGQ